MASNTDPVEDFSFLVNWGGARTGMLRVSPLKWSVSVVDHRAGSSALHSTQKSPGLTAYAPITLEREIVSGDAEFQTWAGEVANASAVAFRRDVIITVLDAQRNPAVIFQLRNCWPSGYEALSELNANATGMAVERLTLEYEWFVRSDP